MRHLAILCMIASSSAVAQTSVRLECGGESTQLRSTTKASRSDSTLLTVRTQAGPVSFHDTLSIPGDPPIAAYSYCGFEPGSGFHLVGRMDEYRNSGFLLDDRTGKTQPAGHTVEFSPTLDQYLAVVQPDGLDGEEWHLYSMSGRELWKGYSFLSHLDPDLGIEMEYAEFKNPHWVDGLLTVHTRCMLNDGSRRVVEFDLTLRRLGKGYQWQPQPACGPRGDTTAILLARRADSLVGRPWFPPRRPSEMPLARVFATADSALRIDTTITLAYTAKARGYAAAGRPQAAIPLFRKSLQMDQDNLGVQSEFDVELARAGDYDEALRGAARLRDNLTMAEMYGFLVEPARAESLMRQSLAKKDWRLGRIHRTLGYLALYGGARDTALAEMQAAVAADTFDLKTRVGLAEVLVPTGRAAEAARLLAPIVARDSAPPLIGHIATIVYGWALREAGERVRSDSALDAALDHLRARRGAGETAYDVSREIAAVYALRNVRDSAIVALRQAVADGMHTFGTWGLNDPVFASLHDDPEFRRLVDAMNEDTRRMRAAVGLP